MDVQNEEIVHDPPLFAFEQLTENFSSLDIGTDMQKGETATDLPLIPKELLIEIFLCMPVKSLLRFKCVSISCYNLFNSRDFIQLHLTRSFQASSDSTLIVSKHSSLHALEFYGPSCYTTELYFPMDINLPQPGTLVGSCNGLVCFSYPNDELALYNPGTRDQRIIPKCTLANQSLHPSVGFAYDPISDDYKVLRNDQWQTQTLLFSLRTDAWEIISKPPWGWDSVKFPCVQVNNSFHWMDFEYKQIKCLDISTRRYYEILIPEKVSPGYFPTLAVFRGQLSIVTYYMDIWILKEYGVQESWFRLFRCPPVHWNNLYVDFLYWKTRLINLACSKDGCKILVALGSNRQSYIFICCDLESKEARMIQIRDLTSQCFTTMSWVESLVPLKRTTIKAA